MPSPTPAPMPEPLVSYLSGRTLASCTEFDGRREIRTQANHLWGTDVTRLLAWLPAAEAWVREG